MYWYIAKLVYQILVNETTESDQFEEQLRLIRAENKQQALGKAMDLGEQEESLFYNYRDEPVYWKFLEVTELQPLPQLDDGLQLYSHLEQPEYTESYVALMQSKAERIRMDTECLY